MDATESQLLDASGHQTSVSNSSDSGDIIGESTKSKNVIKSIATKILDAPPSCIEFSRVDPNVFIVGTYSLYEAGTLFPDKQTRDGGLIVMEWDGQHIYSPFYCHTRSAMLDLHFAPHQPEFLAAATADGNVDIWKLDLRTSKFLVHWQHVPVLDSSQLTLSLAWHPSPEKRTTLAVSFSSGTVAIIDYKHTPTIMKTLAAHSLEAWTVAWAHGEGTPNPGNFYLHSGGDDSILSSFSADEFEYHPIDDEDDPELEAEIAALKPKRDKKNHSAGVTAILPLGPRRIHPGQILLTGSYDEHVRVLMRKDPKGLWKSVAEARIEGGGVWRLKLLAMCTQLSDASEVSESYTVLASCMHAGPRILEVRISQAGEISIHTLGEFLEHESMNYASDATILGGTAENDRQVIHVASTSFYDRKLCIWKYEVDNSQSQKFQIGPV